MADLDFSPKDIVGINTIPTTLHKTSLIWVITTVTGQTQKASAATFLRLKAKVDATGHPRYPLLKKLEIQKYNETYERIRVSELEAADIVPMIPGDNASLFRSHMRTSKSNCTAFFEWMVDVASVAMTDPGWYAKSHSHKESDVHIQCKEWVTANVDTISIATAICPKCHTSTMGVCITGGDAEVEGMVPGTQYIADIFIRLHDGPCVAIEVAHTNFISYKKYFECTKAGTVVYEVETAEIQSAITAGRTVLRTTTMESIRCKECVDGVQGTNKKRRTEATEETGTVEDR
jgi:hypothetical protein